MAIHIVQIEQHKFVCGLFWQSLSRPRDLVREARDLGKKIDSDLMIVRVDHSTAQAGFAQSTDGARKALYSLAAVVSKTLALEGAYYDGVQQPVHNWLGAFKLPDDKWVYFAVRDANFLPNGDFAGTREEVMERLHSDYAMGGWNVVIGEEELSDYGFHNFNARAIATLIPRRKSGVIKTHPWWRLRKINAKRVVWPFALAAGVIVVAGVGGTVYWKYQQKVEAERILAEALENERNRKMREGLVVQPWGTRQLPQAMAHQCKNELRDLTAGGWLLEEFSCSGHQFSYAWSRNDSKIAYLREQVPNAVIDASGEKASLTRVRPAYKGKSEPLLSSLEVVDDLMSRLQMMSVPFKVVAPKPAPVLPGKAAPVEPWRVHTFTLNTIGQDPEVIASVLDRPGVRIDKMTYRRTNWLIEGVIYAK